MAVSLTEIETLVRYMINDTDTSNKDIFYYNTTNIFTLSESNNVTITAVYINNVLTTDYTFDESTNRITINDDMLVDDLIEIHYTCYLNYSSTEVQNNIRAILPYLNLYNFKLYKIVGTEIYPEPTDEEQNLLAIITSIYINPDNVSISLPDLKITVPKDKTKMEKIKDAISQFNFNCGGAIINIEKNNYESL